MPSHPEPALDGAQQHVFASRKAVLDRLFIRAFGVYVIFAVVLTLVLVAEVVLSARAQLQQELSGHEQVFQRALARALWDMDVAQLDALARGALDVPVIERVRITDPASGRVFVDMRKPTVAAETPDDAFASHRFPVRFEHPGGATVVGQAELAATSATVLPRVQRSISLLVALAAIKALAMWFIFRWFARRLIRNPLAELTEAAVAAAPGAAGRIDMQPATRRAVEGTEFETLRDAFNALIERIEANRRRFAQLSGQLEEEVAARTRELQATNERLGALAATDPLTLLANRRGFESFAAIVLAQAARSGDEVSLVSFDIDRFKGVNDAHGHDAGDRVLQALAEALRAGSRTADVAARLGGDEFVLLLPKTGAVEAAEVAERVRAAFTSRPVLLANGREIHATASAGLSASPDGSASLATLLAQADEALYEAKKAGRDQVRTRPHLRLA
jgi:diguanylate cyclase (GGDEF)-like protein